MTIPRPSLFSIAVHGPLMNRSTKLGGWLLALTAACLPPAAGCQRRNAAPPAPDNRAETASSAAPSPEVPAAPRVPPGQLSQAAERVERRSSAPTTPDNAHREPDRPLRQVPGQVPEESPERRPDPPRRESPAAPVPLSVRVPRQLVANQAARIPLAFRTRPEQLSLGKCPEGMTLRETILEWTPGIEQLGSHDVELFAAVDGTRHRLHWSVHVTRPFLEVPFEVSGGLELSADGRRALLWGDEVVTTSGSWYAKVAVVDLDSLRILASREMESLFSVATIVEDEVYVVSPEHVERLAATTLEAVPASRRSPAGGRGWWHACALDDGRSMRFRPGDEKPSDADQLADEEGTRLFGRTGFGRISEGILYDERTGKPLLLLWPHEFRGTTWHVGRTPISELIGPLHLTPNAWHPCSLSDPRRPSRMPGADLLLATECLDFPATLAVSADKEGFLLHASDLPDGRRSSAIRLIRQQATLENVRRMTEHPWCGLDTAAGRYAVLLTGRLYVGRTAELRPEAAAPFHLRPLQSRFDLPLDEAVTIRYRAEGATRYRMLSEELAGGGKRLETDSANGEFTISVKDGLEDLIRNHARRLEQRFGAEGLGREDKIEAYLRLAGPAFQRVTGRRAEGVPVPVGVTVLAETAREVAALRHDFLIDVPRSRFMNVAQPQPPGQ